MAGHSQFKNIMYRKGAQDAKRAKLFAKLAREITVAAKSGLQDPKQNPRLRSAILNARNENRQIYHSNNLDNAASLAIVIPIIPAPITTSFGFGVIIILLSF